MPEETDQHECDICHRKFSSQHGLIMHKRWEHNPATRDALMKAAKKSGLTKIARRLAHPSEDAGRYVTSEDRRKGIFKCTLCDRPPFQSESGLRYHLKSFHGKDGAGLRGAKCEFCGYESSLQGVALHKSLKHGVAGKGHPAQAHRRGTNHECPYCTFASNSRFALDEHLRSDHPGETGMADMRTGQRITVPIQERHEHIKFCPGCGLNFREFAQGIMKG